MRSEYQLPLGELGMKLIPSLTHQSLSIGCQFYGWKKTCHVNIPIGSKVIVIDGEYVENKPFQEIIRRIKESSERILIMELLDEIDSEKNVGNEREKEIIYGINDEKTSLLSLSVSDIDFDDDELEEEDDNEFDSCETKSRTVSDRDLPKHLPIKTIQNPIRNNQQQKDGKLILLQGQIEKVNQQLNSSRNRTNELENVLKEQQLELEQKNKEIQILKQNQRGHDGQLMLLKYRLDKSQNSLIQIDQSVPGTLVAPPSPSALSSEGLTISAFLLHSTKFRKTLNDLQNLHQKSQPSQSQKKGSKSMLPQEDIDGVSSPVSESVSRSIPSPPQPTEQSSRSDIERTLFRTETAPTTLNRGVSGQNLNGSIRGSTSTPIEELSNYQSRYRQDDFSGFIRSKIGLNLVDKEKDLKNITEQDKSIPKRKYSDHPISERNLLQTQQTSHISSKIPLTTTPQEENTFNEMKDHLTRMRLESNVIRDDVKRFREAMREMRVECSLTTPASSSHNHSNTVTTPIPPSSIQPPVSTRSTLSSMSYSTTTESIPSSTKFPSSHIPFTFSLSPENSPLDSQPSFTYPNRSSSSFGSFHQRELFTHSAPPPPPPAFSFSRLTGSDSASHHLSRSGRRNEFANSWNFTS